MEQAEGPEACGCTPHSPCTGFCELLAAGWRPFRDAEDHARAVADQDGGR